VVLYQWACYVAHSYFNWTLAGPMAYLALFQGSTWLTEKISARKYPEYREYQKRVGMFVPKLGGGLESGVGGKRAGVGGGAKGREL
jgi:steroid 5-alpha reductase family enzyme